MGKAPRWSIDGKKIFYLTCQVENCAGPLLPPGEQVMERPDGMPKICWIWRASNSPIWWSTYLLQSHNSFCKSRRE